MLKSPGEIFVMSWMLRRAYFRQEDLLHWASKVRPGGILAGHDYLAAAPGFPCKDIPGFKLVRNADVLPVEAFNV